MQHTTTEETRDQGFTLIELLVVVLIIGVLAAIAIPVFLSQREKAADSATKSDLKNAATVMETEYVDNQTYPANTTALTGAEGFKATGGVTVTVVSADADKFCLKGANGGGSKDYYYDSDGGGLVEAACS